MLPGNDTVWKMNVAAPAICPKTGAVSTDEREFIASMTTPILAFNGNVYHLRLASRLPFVSPIK